MRARHARPASDGRVYFCRHLARTTCQVSSQPSPPILPTLSRPWIVDELTRYARQIRLPQVGADGQARLKAASVLIVGAGGLGSPAAMYLAAAGVGRIGIADGDRSICRIFTGSSSIGANDVGRAKTDSAAATLADDQSARVGGDDRRATSRATNALDLVDAYDVVIDGTDNFPTRYLLNDACVLTGSPARLRQRRSLRRTGVCVRDERRSVLSLSVSPSRRSREPSQNCADAGVLGVLPGLVGTLQATEALKLILGLGEPLSDVCSWSTHFACAFARSASSAIRRVRRAAHAR